MVACKHDGQSWRAGNECWGVGRSRLYTTQAVGIKTARKRLHCFFLFRLSKLILRRYLDNGEIKRDCIPVGTQPVALRHEISRESRHLIKLLLDRQLYFPGKSNYSQTALLLHSSPPRFKVLCCWLLSNLKSCSRKEKNKKENVSERNTLRGGCRKAGEEVPATWHIF